MESAFTKYTPTEPQLPPMCITLTKFLTTRIQETYNVCKRESPTNIKNCLTNPFEARHNYGLDNERNELIVYRHDIIGTFNSFEGKEFSMNPYTISRYEVIEKLGQGTFGQVFKCYDHINNRFCALKILKNKKAYLRQGLLECATLSMLNTYFDSNNERIVKMYDHFMYCDHLCISFELLNQNLYQYAKERRHIGLELNDIQKKLIQLLKAVECCSKAGIIHCDVKPENILMTENGELKLIDLGSSCFENYTLYSYIQSRHYRAPEVVFNNRYNNAIDMWSVGCIIAELFLGVPLFPADSEFDLIVRFVEMLGMPSDEFIKNGKIADRYFKLVKRTNKYRLKESFEFEWENNIKLPPHKNYLYYSSLHDVIMKNPMKLSLNTKENNFIIRECLLDLLQRILVYDPKERLTPNQALNHPFFTFKNINDVTPKDFYEWTPPEREFPFKVYGHSVSADPEDMLSDAFENKVIINKKLTNSEYYNVFFTLLQAGHVPNITIDNPFEYGSITPKQFIRVFNHQFSKPSIPKVSTDVPRSFVAQIYSVPDSFNSVTIKKEENPLTIKHCNQSKIIIHRMTDNK
ncbi:hypothetical protein ENUP19_0044G0011 [Entamoeba nuttalli]|uniref:Serine/threonine-protein kinase, putative n=2 Tax=Entamoeba nuttalli TaxID=412467 RepID=K2HYI6_ENTNP|nr:serine/threonine-protein kinase, putative [Entamoeba nuttalli P19]EKE41465.1 serine/threonine-protein kinase, putative [Entamoeba nuttalli P19]|eukprot:XP_008856203.1 serine/threonine-protein kinase, putative [Entamoeba nuttalli P19]